jgi:hypothetical protein
VEKKFLKEKNGLCFIWNANMATTAFVQVVTGEWVQTLYIYISTNQFDLTTHYNSQRQTPKDKAYLP